ncbi:MAG: putative ABC transporter permease [Pseudobutyrivibrio sp.]|nr:putative ABC transporter permease [Pseudobutyrivibrio sp.]
MLSKYFVCFIIYSFFGWIYETIYCTVSEKSWENRGFLYGPCIPLYGVGAIAAQFLFVDLPIERFSHPSYLAIFFGCAIGSFILEYSTSFLLEKRFNARWWDYSHLPLNINGRVCLIFTVCFGIAGIIVTQFIEPPIIHVVNMMPQSLVELLALFFMFVFGFDMALTISALTSFAKEFERINEQINAQMSQRVEALYSKAESSETEDEGAIKERLSTEYVKQWIKNATATQRGQFRHIAKFTHPVASTKALLDKGSEYLRRRKK